MSTRPGPIRGWKVFNGQENARQRPGLECVMIEREGACQINELLYRANANLGNYRITESTIFAASMLNRVIGDVEEALFLLRMEKNLCGEQIHMRDIELARVGIGAPSLATEKGHLR